MRRYLFLLTIFMFFFARHAFGAFVVNGDGTVTDTSTGLMWQQATAGSMTWDAAISYCEGLSLGGYSDWRLPNINELQSLVDYTRYDPVIDTAAFPDTMSSYYWSSTTNASSTAYAWLVHFGNGGVRSNDKSSTYYVRAVRGGQSGPLDDLVTLIISVYDSGTGYAIEAAQVTVGDTSKETNQSGLATFPELPLGEYQITIEAVGYITYSTTVDLTEAGTVNLTYKLQPVTEDLVTLQLSVYDVTTDSPIAAAHATVGNITKETDQSGLATFPDLPLGEYELTIEAAGYVTYNTTVNLTEAGTVNITCKLQPVIEDVTLQLSVYDVTTDSPIAAAHATVGNITKETDQSGLATFPDLSLGEYGITIEAAGYITYHLTENLTQGGTIYITCKLQPVDLVMVSDSILFSCYGGDSETQMVYSYQITISATVKSTIGGSGIEVAFYEEDPTCCPGVWHLLETKVISSISANSSESTYIVWRPTQRHRIKVEVDPGKKVDETNEANNEAIIEFNEEAVPLHTEYQVVDSDGNIIGTGENLSNVKKAYLKAFNTDKRIECDIAPEFFIPADFMWENAPISYRIDLDFNNGTHKRLPTRFLKSYRIPVIFIPGIFGTNLFGNSMIWKILSTVVDPVDYLMPTGNRGVGADIVNLTGGDPIKIEGALKAKGLKMELLYIPFKFSYKKLIEAIIWAGYIKDETFFEFPYNWILPVTTNALSDDDNVTSLKKVILKVKDKTPVGKVDLICHSTGGLIARSFIQLNNNYNKEINKLIFIEVPHRGSPKAYPLLEGNLPFPEFAYSLLVDEMLLPMANKKNNEPKFDPSDINSVHRLMNSELLHTYINNDFQGLKGLLSDGSSDYLFDIESQNFIAEPINSLLQILNQNVDLKGKGVHYKNIVCVDNFNTPVKLDVRQKSSSYWYPFPFPATAWINDLDWNPPMPYSLVYDWKRWMTAPACVTGCTTRWTSWLDWQWEDGVFLKVNTYGAGDGTVPKDSLMPTFCTGKNFGYRITEVIPGEQDGVPYGHDALPSSPMAIEITLDYLLGPDGHPNYHLKSRAKEVSTRDADSAVSVEKEMMVSWSSTADLTVVDPSGRFVKISPGLYDIDGDIPDFYCYSLKDQSAVFGIRAVLDGSYEFRISGPAGTTYELRIIQSVNSFEVDEQSFSGTILEEGQIITHQIGSPDNQPMALVSADPNPAISGQPISFDASRSYHLSGEHSISSYEWDWTSDGMYDDSGINVTHTYPEEGDYIVTLQVTDDNVPPKSMTIRLAVVVSKDFEANFVTTSSQGCAPFTANFQDLSTGAVSWSWDFNHDGIEDSQEQNPSYRYEVPGTYTVSLTITGNGKTDTMTMQDYILVSDCAAVLYVDQNAQGNGDGTSWQNAFTTIHEAIAAAQPGNHIWVASGVYHESFQINGLSIYGGFTGTEVNVNQRDSIRDHTTIDGEGQRSGISVTNGTIDGFTIINHQGSGIIASEATISNNIIMNNYAQEYGGGIYVEAQSSIKNNIITNNRADLMGGGIYVNDAWACIVNNTICHNSKGGIFFTHASSGIITNNIICSNFEAEGIMGETGSTVEISYNNLWNNIPSDFSSSLSFETEDNISADPLFIENNNGNYFLQPDSPCVNTGHPDSSYNDPDGTRNDMGAYGGDSLSYNYFADLDTDGYALIFGDWDDSDFDVHPGAVEICDGKDNDGDGQIDPEGSSQCVVYYLDEDGDGYGADGKSRCLCNPDNVNKYTALQGGDINDLDPLDAVFQGVHSLCAIGTPGPLFALNDTPIPIVAGDDDTTPIPSAVAMASVFGNGRVIALGHDGFLTNEALDLFDNKQFGLNVINWLDKDSQKKVLITTGHREWYGGGSNSDNFKAELESHGYTVTGFSGIIDASALTDIGVVLIGNAWGEVSDSEIEALTDFVNNGGGLFLIGLGWSWEPYNPGFTLDDYPMNKIAQTYGIRWIDGYISDATDNYEGQPVFHTFYPDIEIQTIDQSLSFIESITSAHPDDLPALLQSDDIVRQNYTRSHVILKVSSGELGQTSPQCREIYDFYLNLFSSYPQYFHKEKIFNKETESTMAWIRECAYQTLVEALPLTEDRKSEIASAMGLFGRYLELWQDFTVLLLDNSSLEEAQRDFIYRYLEVIPTQLHNLRFISVRDFLGQTFPEVPLCSYTGGMVNIFGSPIGAMSENSFPDDVTPGMTDTFCIVVAHEINHVVDSYYVGNVTSGRDALIEEAGTENMNYLRSMFEDGFFVSYPQEFFASIANQWFTDSRKTIELGLSRFDRGYPYPLDQAIFFADIYSLNNDYTYFYTTDTQGNILRQTIPLTRNENENGRITSFIIDDLTYNFTIDADDKITSYNIVEKPQVATLTGFVFNQATGKPLPGARATIKGGISGATGKDGAYQLNEISPGAHDLDFRKKGFKTNILSGIYYTPERELKINTALSPIKNTTVAKFSGISSIRGFIYNKATGDPLQGVRVMIVGYGQRTTDASGFYQHLNVPSGVYTIKVTKPGFRQMILKNILFLANKPLEIDLGMVSLK